MLPEEAEDADENDAEPRFAIVGRPNVGKSSLFNRLVGEERSVVYEEAGTTRDAVDALVSWSGEQVRFVDTAGFRRPTRVKGVDYYSFLRAERAIERAHVALLVLDASEGFAGEDKRIAARVMEIGRGLVVVANKWDLVDERDRAFREAHQAARAVREGAGPAHVGEDRDRRPPAPTGARDGARALVERHPTAQVNEVVQGAQAERSAPGGVGYRCRTQVTSAPPRFVLFEGLPPPASYQRFLEGRLRRAELDGVPVRLRFRKGQRR